MKNKGKPFERTSFSIISRAQGDRPESHLHPYGDDPKTCRQMGRKKHVFEGPEIVSSSSISTGFFSQEKNIPKNISISDLPTIQEDKTTLPPIQREEGEALF
ncbi:MAG: hypothetical protein CSB23_03425 [Deltaproteobacteria bacterium]|nr:MAG: hypothetical protein CSB23_03425 [Deltaproteobacteria bacterium]